MTQNTDHFHESARDALARICAAENAKKAADQEMERVLREGLELLAGDVRAVSWHFDPDPGCSPAGTFLPAGVMLHMPEGRENVYLGADIELWQIVDNDEMTAGLLKSLEGEGDYDDIQDALCVALALRTGIPSWCVEDFLARLAQYINGVNAAGRLDFGQCKQPEGAGMVKEAA